MRPIETATFDLEGITFKAEIFYDPDTKPHHYDASIFTPEDIEAWRKDDWCFALLEVTPVINGTEIAAASVRQDGYLHGHVPSESRYRGLKHIWDEAKADYARDWLEALALALPGLEEEIRAVALKLSGQS